VADVIASMRFSAFFSEPLIVHSTSAVCRSFEIWSACAGSSGERMSSTSLKGATACATSLTAERNSALEIVSVLLWIRTISVFGPDCLKPAFFRSSSALCAWPTFASWVWMFFVPVRMPMASAPTTNTSQTATAVFQ
jgi:hypothetical protein